MSKRYIVVGGVAGGASAAARIRRIDEKADIQIYDKGPNISFSNCCLPNYFSNEVESIEDLILYNPEEFKASFNLSAKVRHEVTKILADEHKVVVKNLETGEEYEDHYDKLILSPGANAIVPKSIKNVDADNVFIVKNVHDVRKIDAFFKENDVNNVVVVGGGFIGVEMVENLRESGKEVTLIELDKQIMKPLDYDMVQMLHKELYDHGVNLVLGDALAEVCEDKVILCSGKEIETQAVILAIGVTPDVKFAVDSGVELGETGGILVDHNFRTNLKDVYAVGDAIETFNSITKKKTRLPLAGPAQRQARSAADHIFGRFVQNKGVIGSSCIRVFGLNAASTGLNEKACKENNINYGVALVIPMDKVKLMPNPNPMHFKLIYEVPTGKILGAQAISKGDATRGVNVIATMITMNGTLEDLKELELCYAPPFGTAKTEVNFASLTALNVLNGEYKQVPMEKVRELVENKEYIIDVRGKEAYEKGHVKGAINIPIDEVRDRYEEIPKDRPIYVYCRTSWDSYYVLRALKGLGFEDVTNIQGSFLQLSYNEYFNDKTTDRESILTGYNFE
ncbi:MAG: FAD-dependent oxidoreductase [Tissierellia bacterium]|nr:FAD-dependent oxidoreductase [Tissierellia bacterium]